MTTKTERITLSADERTAYFGYLDDLRASGDTNMFGARPYLVAEFGLEPKRAAAILVEWMRTFAERHP